MIELPDQRFIVLPEVDATVEGFFHDAGKRVGYGASFLIQEHGQPIELAVISIGNNKLV